MRNVFNYKVIQFRIIAFRIVLSTFFRSLHGHNALVCYRSGPRWRIIYPRLYDRSVGDFHVTWWEGRELFFPIDELRVQGSYVCWIFFWNTVVFFYNMSLFSYNRLTVVQGIIYVLVYLDLMIFCMLKYLGLIIFSLLKRFSQGAWLRSVGRSLEVKGIRLQV